MKFKTLKDLCTDIIDCPHTTPNWKMSGIPVVRNYNLKNGFIDTSNLSYVDEETFKKRIKRGTPEENDLVFSREAPVGSVGIIPSNFKCCLGQRLVLLKVNQDLCDPHYLLYVMLSNFVKKQYITVEKTGSIVSNFNIGDLRDLVIPYVNMELQKKISGICRSIDYKVNNNNRLISTLESLSKTLYDYYFLQFDFPDEKGRPYKSSGGKMEYNAELGREIPEGWKVEYLAEHITSNRGISYSTKTLGDNGIPMINLASFGPYGSYKESGLKYYIGNYTKEDIIKPYDLIMCNTQQTAIKFETDIIGHAFLVPDIFNSDIVSSHHMTKISVDNEALKYYLVKLFNTAYFHKYISGHTNGTNILGLLFSGVSDYKEAMPPQAVLDNYANKVKPIEQEKSRVIKENRHLTALRDFLLPLLMNGQVGFKNP